MRATLDIDDHALAAAKEMARREHLSVSQVISRPAWLALTSVIGQRPPAPSVDGFRPFAGGVLVSNELVNTLREAKGA